MCSIKYVLSSVLIALQYDIVVTQWRGQMWFSIWQTAVSIKWIGCYVCQDAKDVITAALCGHAMLYAAHDIHLKSNFGAWKRVLRVS